MNLIYTGHAQTRMRQRSITKDQVEEALADLLSEWATPEGSVQYLGRTAAGSELIVWLVAPGLTPPRAIVKSAAWKQGRSQ